MKKDVMLFDACRWSLKKTLAEKGFIVAADLTQEWLLPWWFENYSKHNNLPVAFVDFGLSKEMKQWCQEKGHYINLPIPDVFVAEKDTLPTQHIEFWENQFGTHFWKSRNAWFKKPLACLQSPYQKSVWMDLDCEIKGSLLPIFSLPDSAVGLTIAKGYSFITDGADVNSGVIFFQRGSPIIEDWAKEAIRNNHVYVGDQDILYDLILKKNLPIGELPSIYNWSRFSESNPNALVVHWHGDHGKSFITHQIQKSNMQKEGLL
ncbi:MAG: hypothetical protein JSS09_09885 [Verrucomicrobia bacterium]|nr:hypothetical protein [Verrucomicrobiota bacterium]